MRRRPKPAVPGDLRKVKDARLSELLDGRRGDAARLVREGRASRNPAAREETISELQVVVEDVKRLEGEQSRREDAREQARYDRRGIGSIHDRLATQETEKQRRERMRDGRERERAQLQAREAEKRRAERVEAGLIWEPVGGWDADGADALAAVFGSSLLFDYLDRRGQVPVLDLQHVAHLLALLAMIAENGGVEATFDIGRIPRLPEGAGGDKNMILRHLTDNQLLDVERSGPRVTIRHGRLVRELRESFQAQWAERSRPRSFSEEASEWLAEAKHRLLGQAEPTP